MSRWIPVAEFAQRCGRAKNTVVGWCIAGRCPPLDRPLTARQDAGGLRKWFVQEDELDAICHIESQAEDPDWITPVEFATRAGYSPATIVDVCEAGRFPPLGRPLRATKRPRRDSRGMLTTWTWSIHVDEVNALHDALSRSEEWITVEEFAHGVGWDRRSVLGMLRAGRCPVLGRALNADRGGVDSNGRFQSRMWLIRRCEVAAVATAQVQQRAGWITLTEFAQRCRIPRTRVEDWVRRDYGNPLGRPLRAELREGLDSKGRPKAKVWYVDERDVDEIADRLRSQALSMVPDAFPPGVDPDTVHRLRHAIDHAGANVSRNQLVEGVEGRRETLLAALRYLAARGEYVDPPSVEDRVRAAFNELGDSASVRKVAEHAGVSPTTVQKYRQA